MTDEPEVPAADPEDPHGDKAFLERRRRGRIAVHWGSRQAAGDVEEELPSPVEEVDEVHVAGERKPRRLRAAGGGSAADTDGVDPAIMHTARFAAARSALLDVETPAEASEAASEMADAARKLRGFAWEPDELGLPPNMPVRALGKRGQHLYFLNPIDELVEITASKLSTQGELDNLFSPDGGYMWGFYGQRSKQGEWRIKYEDVRRDLIHAAGVIAHREGVFDPAQRVRGRGGWKTADGILVLHLGDALWVAGEELPLGELDGYVYTREETLARPIRPSSKPAMILDQLVRRWGIDPTPRAAGLVLLEMLKTWHFHRAVNMAWLDARLELGHQVCVLMGAALDWRPQTYVIGDAGTGKTTLQQLRKQVLGRRLMDVVDPTSPGIYQTLGRASIGVSIDEFEVEGDDTSESRNSQVLKLARFSSSGARVVRGGQDGVPSNYEARGVFGFSGINMPALKPAEASRMAILALHPHKDDSAKPPALSAAEGEAIGRALLARVADRWHEWPEVLEAWRNVILNGGQSSRVADQFGTLLAAAHLVCHDGSPRPGQVEDMAQHIGRYQLAETANIKTNWERCLDWLLAAQPEAWRGLKLRSVGDVLEAYLNNRYDEGGEAETSLQAVRRRLASAGLALVFEQDALTSEVAPCLGIPSSHQQVGALFRGTQWGTRAGGAEGTWATALSLAPADVARRDVLKLDGRSVRGLKLRLSKLIAVDGAQEEPGANG